MALFGTIEIVSFETELTERTLYALQPMAEVAASALASAVDYEQERHNALSSITRLTAALRFGEGIRLHFGDRRALAPHGF